MHVSKEQNFKAGLVSKLASSKKIGFKCILIQETFVIPIIKLGGANTIDCPGWLLDDTCNPLFVIRRTSTRQVRSEVNMQSIRKEHYVVRMLYKMRRAYFMLTCLGEHEISLVLVDVRRGDCDNYIGGRALADKLLGPGLYWTSLMNDNIIFVKRCDKFHRHVNLHHALAELFHYVTTSWPFY